MIFVVFPAKVEKSFEWRVMVCNGRGWAVQSVFSADSALEINAVVTIRLTAISFRHCISIHIELCKPLFLLRKTTDH